MLEKDNLKHAPKMSNRKLRHELDELKKQVAELRKQLASRPTVIIREIRPAFVYPAPYLPPPPPEPSWTSPIITCGVTTRFSGAPDVAY